MADGVVADCIFCKIVSGEIPVKRVFEDELVVVFPDINPQAPTHLLVIPKEHLESTEKVVEEHTPMLGRLLAVAAKVAPDAGLTHGYRLVINTGRDGGQTVGHLHLHLLGGRAMHWPPG